MKCAESLRTQAYFDGEVDAMSAAEIERHAEHCPECSALLQDLEQTRTAIRRDLAHDRAPPELRARITHALDQETAVKSERRSFGWGQSTWRTRAFWVGAFGGIGSAAVAATVAFLLLSPSLDNSMLDGLAAAHVRSLMPSHLIDVASTDQHTVKPWFAGHADVSPVVADFAQAGYRLIGGRADYLERQRSAVVVYQHGAHVINVFSWAAQRTLPKNTTRNGYRMAFWKDRDLEYCAVSDTGWAELMGLVRLLQELGARDAQE
ncbi:MAG TPA: zf-HC2 domain-containing protein [Steroidobacteraceae bacterium]